MTTMTTWEPITEIAQPGQRVRWRNPGQARAYGWEAVFGGGPFVVVRTVDHSADGLATGLVLRTEMGEVEIFEIWLALADEEVATASGTAVPIPATRRERALSQRR